MPQTAHPFNLWPYANVLVLLLLDSAYSTHFGAYYVFLGQSKTADLANVLRQETRCHHPLTSAKCWKLLVDFVP
jgi:hypothetical protein